MSKVASNTTVLRVRCDKASPKHCCGTILEARENLKEWIQARLVGVELHVENLERPKKFYIELHPLARSLQNNSQLNSYHRGDVVKNLFVGNLGSEVTHEELRRLSKPTDRWYRSISSWIATPGCRAGLHSWR